MSTGGPNTQRFSPFTPPLRGSFPLDHEHTCNNLIEDYLNCLRQYNLRKNDKNGNDGDTTKIEDNNLASSSVGLCRPLAKLYLECRMKAGLMTEEDLKSLGF